MATPERLVITIPIPDMRELYVHAMAVPMAHGLTTHVPLILSPLQSPRAERLCQKGSLCIWIFAGVGVETNLINVAPCLVSNGAGGIGIEANLISIIPQLFKFEPNGVNVEPSLINIEPQLVGITPKGVGVEAVGIAIENSLIEIAPVGKADSFHV